MKVYGIGFIYGVCDRVYFSILPVRLFQSLDWHAKEREIVQEKGARDREQVRERASERERDKAGACARVRARTCARQE